MTLRTPSPALVRLAGTLAAGSFAIWLSYQLSPGDRSLYTLMGLYAIVAIGLSLLIGFAGQISLGQGAFYALGAYTAGILTVGLDPDDRFLPEAGFDPALAVVAAPILTGLVAAVIGVPPVTPVICQPKTSRGSITARPGSWPPVNRLWAKIAASRIRCRASVANAR